MTSIECEKKDASIFTNCENTAENHMRILGFKIAIEKPCKNELKFFLLFICSNRLFKFFCISIF